MLFAIQRVACDIAFISMTVILAGVHDGLSVYSAWWMREVCHRLLRSTGLSSKQPIRGCIEFIGWPVLLALGPCSILPLPMPLAVKE